MRKKSLLVGMMLVMSAAMINGCGDSKKNYASDVEAINTFSEAIENMEDFGDYSEAAKAMEMKTPEGKVIKEDMEKLGGYMEDLSAMMEDYENVDEDEMTKLTEDVEALQEEVEEHAQDFVDAAEKSGLADEDLEDLGLEF